MISKMHQLAKYGLILAAVCLGGFFSANAQEVHPAGNDSTKVIHIIQSDKLNVLTKDDLQLNRFIGNAIFRQGNTLFYCDSALINRASNVLDAYGHIHINQADSIHIYGEYLHYEGNTKLATLRDNARLTDNKITISGPELQYDMNARIGTYLQGGKLVNGTSVLTSREGYYYADTKDVYFHHNVLLVDPAYTLTTDTLLYNTETKIATIVAPTTINDGKTIMYATSGQYDTETGKGDFGNRPTIEDSTATITADRITMDKLTGLAYANGNMVYRDTARKMILLANYGTVNQKEKTILATQHPLMIQEREKDTFYLAADTLFSGVIKKDAYTGAAVSIPTDGHTVEEDSLATKSDTIMVSPKDSIPITLKTPAVAITPPPSLPPPTDSAGAAKDTSEIRYIKAWHHVRIFSDSLQGVADSVYYSSKDSIFRLYRNPVLWANSTQLSGDTIFMYTKNQQADKLVLDQNSIMIKEAGPGLYNQIKGNLITGYFVGQALDWMHVDGNAESIYYIQDDDKAYISVNRTLSGVINIYFIAGELHHIAFIKDPEGTMYPFTQRPLDQMELENFHWDINRRPKSKYELMGTAGEAKIKEESTVEKKTDDF